MNQNLSQAFNLRLANLDSELPTDDLTSDAATDTATDAATDMTDDGFASVELHPQRQYDTALYEGFDWKRVPDLKRLFLSLMW